MLQWLKGFEGIVSVLLNVATRRMAGDGKKEEKNEDKLRAILLAQEITALASGVDGYDGHK